MDWSAWDRKSGSCDRCKPSFTSLPTASQQRECQIPQERQKMSDNDLLIALNAVPTVPRAVACQLGAELDRWQGQRVNDNPAALAHRLGVPAEHFARVLALRRRAPRLARQQHQRAEQLGARLITIADTDYPGALRDLTLPPPVLYCRGELSKGPAVAIVGSRKMNAYGKEVASRFARELAEAGLTIVSGFARGVDTAAHRGALESGGYTLAVLGCGLDIDYPRGQTDLALDISRSGACLSEFPFGCEPRGWHFPVRNRLIAALARGTLVVQAAVRSGSLNTAHHALELGREVYAVPGRIDDPLAGGTNGLLADGALVARSPRDVLECLALEQLRLPTAPAMAPKAPDRPLPEGVPGKLVKALPPGDEATAEELAERLGLPIDQTLGLLLELELGGWINRRPGPVYSR
nr:DNA processing protein DprA-like [Nerophis lumbriciformis]